MDTSMILNKLFRMFRKSLDCSMVLILNVAALDLIKCLKKIKLQILPLSCALISELPSDICTMDPSEKDFFKFYK